METSAKANRILFWVLLFLILLNLGAFITWFVISRPQPEPDTCTVSVQGGCRLLKQELGLSQVQSDTVDTLLARYRRISEPIAISIRQKRGDILEGLSANNADTVLLKQYAAELSALQTSLQEVNMRQFLDLKKVCTPEQLERLSDLYLEMYGCPMKGQGQNNKHMYRHRHGQEKCNNNPSN